ncbi:MAG TPA: cytochrome bc complex cytochrome b subunit [Solirubrobacteraceae bacterium]|nr:cytochrome bc complex cytochrome b subunit [Solirubrobacteraceae bacterium]
MPKSVRRRAVRFARWNEQRVGASTGLKWMLNYVFPDHWSFLLGEIALYSFIVLIGTGIFLALFYVPSANLVVYHGSYGPLVGEQMSVAYQSVVKICLSVPAGLLMRDTHHWAADVFIAAILVHFARIVFTSAYRKPRDLNFWIGLTMLMLAIFEGFAGYSLVDDLLSGMGLVIAYAVALSIPFIGAQLAFLFWDGPYPGSSRFFPRLELLHIFIIPMAIAVLITVHLAMIMRQHHSQFPGRGRRERNVVGTPMWPAYALRSIGLLLATAGVLFLLGGEIQINPIWQWGPYHVWLSENGAQPDWYIGWLIGALRLMPNFEPHIGNVTIIPNPFWGGAFFPLLCFGIFFAWPWLDRKFTKDHRRHDLLVRPRDRPTHTGLVAAILSWIFAIYAAGSDDRIFYRLHINYTTQIHFWEAAIWVVPVVVFLVTRGVCKSLQRSSAHPLRAWQGEIVRRRPDGSIETLALSEDRLEAPPSQPPVGTLPGKETRE